MIKTEYLRVLDKTRHLETSPQALDTICDTTFSVIFYNLRSNNLVDYFTDK